MTTRSTGISLSEVERERLSRAAQALHSTPHAVLRQALLQFLQQFEAAAVPGAEASAEHHLPLAAALTAATRRAEPECLPPLLELARLTPAQTAAAQAHARGLIAALRAKSVAGRSPRVQGLLQEFSLSSDEGIALMCLAEALLRIPDAATRDALIRDKIARGDWAAHLGNSRSLFVNAAAWGLLLSGRLVATHSEGGLVQALARLLARGGEPVVRAAVDMAVRLMGEQFVAGQNIEEALARSAAREAQGFRHSYDMLGEAALTDADALRYTAAYAAAIEAIGKAAGGRGIYAGAGISLKLSALHPRYCRAQQARVMSELYPRLLGLAQAARHYALGFNIDAEESERLELSLQLFARLAAEPSLAGWNGLGFVVQAYQKRAPSVIDWLIALARRQRRRLMLRLVKGAYWDSEIKRAQVEGQSDYPVFTRKLHTDVSYLACARKLLAASDAVYPQFATHNAATLAALWQMAGADHYPGQYEFQCLHGMGEPLYEDILAHRQQARACRIYAPVGAHESLLPYLVRRLLENGANSSFVHRVADPTVALDELVADPVIAAEAIHPLGAPHPGLPLPQDLYAPLWANSAGQDLNSEGELSAFSAKLAPQLLQRWHAEAGSAQASASAAQSVHAPAATAEVVGEVREAERATLAAALLNAQAAQPLWQALPPHQRAQRLEAAAQQLEAARAELVALALREAGKTIAAALGEVREAADFLRYYAAQIRHHADCSSAALRPIGPVLCISPWNFPLAIFVGQAAAALAAGNVVLAKPAEQTPLVAARAVALLHAAGIPHAALQLLPGPGETVGATLVADPRVHGVLFTGSTEVARHIARSLAGRLLADGSAAPLVAETGGQNVMIADSSALPEQIVSDALASAFDSAGQRCSALRVLCLQEDIADSVLAMLKAAMRELVVGRPEQLASDIGPLIDATAAARVAGHIESLRRRGRHVHHSALAPECISGHFIAPCLIEIKALSDLSGEVFGPVLHVLRYRRDALPALLDAVNASGYGLTLGLHTRLNETIALVSTRAQCGNLYVNRNMIGATVGVQPFGGEGLSGTGPKAGGPLTLAPLLLGGLPLPVGQDVSALAASAHGALDGFIAHAEALRAQARAALAALAAWCPADSAAQRAAARWHSDPPVGRLQALPGPTGEANLYALLPRGRVLCFGHASERLAAQLVACIASGNRAVLAEHGELRRALQTLPELVAQRIDWVRDLDAAPAHAALFAGAATQYQGLLRQLAQREGAVLLCHCLDEHGDYPLTRLLTERVLTVNTAAAGGNASLMNLA